MSKPELIKKLRCLRMHLAPLLTSENLEVLEDVERELKNGGVSTHPANSPKKKKNNQGTRVTKKQIYNNYLMPKI